MAIQRKESFVPLFLTLIALFTIIYVYEYDRNVDETLKDVSLGSTERKNNVTAVGHNDYESNNEETMGQNPIHYHNNDNKSEEDMETHLQHVIKQNATGNVLTETDSDVNENSSNDNNISNEDDNKNKATATDLQQPTSDLELSSIFPQVYPKETEFDFYTKIHNSMYPVEQAGKWVYKPGIQAIHPSPDHLICLDQERQGNCHDEDAWKKSNDTAKQTRHNSLIKCYVANSPGILAANDPWVWQSELLQYRVLSNEDPDLYKKKVRKGLALYKKEKKIIDKVEKDFLVEKELLLSLMGIETNYGKYLGKMDIISSLATLSFDKRRSEFFT